MENPKKTIIFVVRKEYNNGNCHHYHPGPGCFEVLHPCHMEVPGVCIQFYLGESLLDPETLCYPARHLSPDPVAGDFLTLYSDNNTNGPNITKLIFHFNNLI